MAYACKDVDDLMVELGYEDKCADLNKASLKVLLLHNDNIYAFIPVAHSVQLKETFETIKLSLNAFQYLKFALEIFANLHIISFN